MVPQAKLGENQAWMLCELSLVLAEAGRGEEALRAWAQAREMAEQDAVPQEVLFRRRDHAALLAALGRYGEALDILETAAALSLYGADPAVHHHLLAGTCHIGPGDAGAAQDCLAPALALIDQQAEGGNTHLARLRLQAEALVARL